MDTRSDGEDVQLATDPENAFMDDDMDVLDPAEHEETSNAVSNAQDQDTKNPGILSSTAPASQPPPHVDAQGRVLNPRSCVTCRKRKVKCDKIHPCSNCSRAHIDCVFPAPGRAPRKARKIGEGRDKELLERLRRLEGVVKGLGVEVPKDMQGGLAEAIKKPKDNGASEEPGHRIHGSGDESSGIMSREDPARDGLQVSGSEGYAQDEMLTMPHMQESSTNGGLMDNAQWVENQSQGRFENRFGRLVVNEGRSRYVNTTFWASLSNEVEDLKGILNEESDDDGDEVSPPNMLAPNDNHQGFVFGFSSQSADLLSLHPLPNQIPKYWQTYKENVDPLVKVLHIPSTEPTILRAASHLSNLSKGFEPLLFSIYYGATTSLSPEDCRVRFGEEKTILLARYRFALEQALARANFLTTEEAIVLQAFIIFLICLRRNSDARVIWTLTGLVVRIAQTIGIHRDGTHFGLPPFEVEMRRRLWWQVCILDTRASEDHGCDPTITEQSFDTQMPLNVEDTDLTPEMKSFPKERKGCTNMTFCLIRFEVSNTFRRINYVPPGLLRGSSDTYASVSLADKERWITECHNRLEERYLAHCDMSVPLYWVTATVARLMMSKMWLMVYHPFQRQDGGASLPPETRDKLFITSLENIEYSILLETEARTMQWGWLFKTYMQWHALAFILSELCVRTTGDMVERAWIAVSKTRGGRWGSENITDETPAGRLWRPLKKLYRKAREQRARGLREEELAKQRASDMPRRTYSPNANPMFGHSTSRPAVTRAPLSLAQLQRFSNYGGGPSYGDRPIDSHRLLRSPRTRALSLAELDPGDLVEIEGQRGRGGASATPVARRAMSRSGSQGLAGFEGLPAAFAQPGQKGPTPFGQNILNGRASVDFNAPMTGTTAAALGNSTNAAVSTNNNPTNTAQRSGTYAQDPAAGAFEFDLDAMEGVTNIDSNKGSGDDLGLNWEGWDQLVRQFGMDVDGGPAGLMGNESAVYGWGGQSSSTAGSGWEGI
ncbi:hypothetical protein MBLNU230_g3453t1 [Neophaeotheca triangularis]